MAIDNLIEVYNSEISQSDPVTHDRLRNHNGYRADQLCCWAGLMPRHRESGDQVQRGSISRQGSVLLRWAAVEAGAGEYIDNITFIGDTRLFCER